jgi:hypothetical protein
MLPPQISQTLKTIPALIDKTFPIPGRFRGALPSDVAKLSSLLTGARGERALSYLSRPNFLSAYLRYFLPWNLYRLCCLLPSLELPLRAGNRITDLGSGPLTFACALWISRPDLRALPLEFYCVDRSAPALEAGKRFFAALCEGVENSWKIHLVKEELNVRGSRKDAKAQRTQRRRKGEEEEGSEGRRGAGKWKEVKEADLVCALNLFNEIYEGIPHNNREGLREMSERIASFMSGYVKEEGLLLVVEPGVPQSGRFISMLRDAFLEQEREPLSPCTHSRECVLTPHNLTSASFAHKIAAQAAWRLCVNQFRKGKWCHFAFDAGDAAKELQGLSAAAGIPKERLVFSFLLAGARGAKKAAQPDTARVISDAFPLPNRRFGRYSCSEKGLVLLAGDEKAIEGISSGSLVKIKLTDKHDEKSGALIAEAL